MVMLNRMRDPIAETVLPESQCGFRRNRGTTNMIFAVRQLMEKAREQHRNLYMDSLKDTVKQSNISTTQWQDSATDRSTWRRSIHDGLMLYDDSRSERNATKRARRRAARNATSSASQDTYMCRHCERICSSRIGILSHERACNKQRGRDT